MLSGGTTYHFIRGTILLLLFGGLFGWLLWRALKRTEDPVLLIIKWVLTAGVVTFMALVVAPVVGKGGYAAIGGVFLTVACGFVLAIIWRRSIANIVAKPFGALYDGGDAEIEPRPYYSIAEAKRKKGQYTEAIAEIRKQLEKFPTDVEGQMKLAEIQAENLNDLQGAEVTINRLCAQPGQAPRHIAIALNTLADWHLKYAVDREAAKADLQRIVDMFPESEFALLASQRIGHLAGTAELLASHDRQRIQMREGIKNIGLLQSSAHLQPAAADPAQTATEYVKHLESHPQDTEVREKLAVLYADHYQRLDLAADQLNQMIEQPNQPAKSVVRWLNLLADLQIRHGAGYDAAWTTLGRIIERYPNSAAADLARNRMDLLKLELKIHEQKPSVKLGQYEQNIGLKSRRGPR